MSSLHQTPQGLLSRDETSSWLIADECANTASSKCDLLKSLKDPEYREGFIESHVYTGIAFQIRALREKREGMTQAELGKLARMAQERISILEDPNATSKPAINTLLRIANALGVGLQVRFAPFSRLIHEAVETDEDELNVPSFEEELPKLEDSLSIRDSLSVNHSAPRGLRLVQALVHDEDDTSRGRKPPARSGGTSEQLVEEVVWQTT